MSGVPIFANGAQTAAIQYLFNHVAGKGQIGRKTHVSTSTDANGGHVYTLTTDLCSTNTCSADEVFSYVNQNSVPFTDDYHDGHHTLPGLPFEGGPDWASPNPIIHTSNPELRTSTNIAMPGHVFYPGNVVHSVSVVNDRVIVQTTGVGSGSTRIEAHFNNFVGVQGFMPLHNGLKRNF